MLEYYKPSDYGSRIIAKGFTCSWPHYRSSREIIGPEESHETETQTIMDPAVLIAEKERLCLEM